MRDWLSMLAVAGVLALAATGCAGPPTGSGGTPRQTSAAPATSVTALPPRPREIDLIGVDTCTLLTTEQQRQLGTDRPPGLSNYPDRYGNQSCSYGKSLSSPRFGYSVKVVTQEDATVYLTGERDVTARVVLVAGFPAVENRRPTDERGCFVDVSTKDGQYLSVQYAESTGSNDTAEVACEKARVAAELAMLTLLTQR
ncbi:MAG: DUF3558 domain-containing protein [Pseudonocardiaceae bacterium]